MMLVNTQCEIRWNPAFIVELIENEAVFICSEQTKIILRGKAYCALAPLLSKGTYSADVLAEKLEGKIEPEMVYYALLELEKNHTIQANSSLLPSEIAAYLGELNISEQEAYSKLKTTKVYVKGGDEIYSLLAALQIELTKDPSQADFHLICTQDYLQVESIPEAASWMLCKPYGNEIWIGPCGSCYHCLKVRLKLNRIEEAYLEEEKGLTHFSPPTHAVLPTTRNLAWNLIATEVFKQIVLDQNEALKDKIQKFNTLTLERSQHQIVKRATCSHCGNPHASSSQVVLKRRKKREVQGGFRSMPAEETLKRYAHLVSPLSGVVQYLKPSKEVRDSAIYVYVSGTNWALPKFNTGRSLSSFREVSAGKGTTDVAAKVGALCEALERTSGLYHGDEKRVRASYCELGKEAIHPDAVSLFSQHQLQNRQEETHSFWRVYPPFPEQAEISWTPLYSLTEKREKYYPTSCSYYRAPKESWVAYGDSNGCAAGNCLEEAILQGFLELVERDSVAIWWYNRLEVPSVDLESFHHPYIGRMQEEYARLGREFWVLDITSDLGIPTFASLSRLKEEACEQIYLGFGSHLCPEVALLRAVTEMNQFMGGANFWETEHFGDGKQDAIDKKFVREWMQKVTIKEHPYLHNATWVKKASDYPSWESADLLEDIHHCQKIVEGQGMEMLVLDQTRPEIGLNVARVIVPGLRHFWPRFAPGRLYDVPVQLGRLKAPLQEEQLNPIGMFL